MAIALRKHDEDEEHDEYFEIDDERPTIEPSERPTDQRGERPMRTQVTSRWGPSRRNNR